MTHSISTESTDETLDALNDLIAATNELMQSAQTHEMRSTSRELVKVLRFISITSHRLEAGSLSVDAALACLDSASDSLADIAARIGGCAHARA